MHRLERRVQALEQSRPKRPAQIVWNNHDEETAQKVHDLEAQGIDVMLVGWVPPLDPDAP